jgi:hypothetical protein
MLGGCRIVEIDEGKSVHLLIQNGKIPSVIVG